MKIKEKYYRFAEKGQQIQRVNRFFVTEYLIFYAFILFMLWASRAKGVRSLGFAAFVSVIAVVSGGALLIGWKRRPESERLRYLALIGLYLVSFFMTFAYTESFIRFLGLAPFIGCILFHLAAHPVQAGRRNHHDHSLRHRRHPVGHHSGFGRPRLGRIPARSGSAARKLGFRHDLHLHRAVPARHRRHRKHGHRHLHRNGARSSVQ